MSRHLDENLQADAKGRKNKKLNENYCSFHNSSNDSNKDCYQQNSSGKCKKRFTVDGKSNDKHEINVVDRTKQHSGGRRSELLKTP